MSVLILDPKTHIYTVDGIRKPGITEIIKSAGLVDDRWYTDYSAERGSAAHKACHFFDENDLDESSVDPAILPYLEAWKKFRAESGFSPEIIEEPLYSEAFQFAGTPDRAGILNGDIVIPEIKTGLISVVTGIQLAAQQILLEEVKGIRVKKRFAVQLTSRGTYKLTQFPDPHDRAIFLHCLSVHNFKVQNNLIKEAA